MYQFVKELGKGTFGRVVLVYNYILGRYEAVKCVKRTTHVLYQEEIVYHGSLPSHPNIIDFYNVLVDNDYLFISMEYAHNGDMFTAISHGLFSEKSACFYFCQLLDAVEHCHLNGIAHRDIKLENLLLDGNVLKLCDFGYSYPIDKKIMQVVGTPIYLAPEIIMRDPSADLTKADVWACGIVLFIMLTGSYPFEGKKNVIEVYKNIVSLNFKIPPLVSSEAKDIILKILTPDHSKRLGILELKKHPWVVRCQNTSDIE